MKKLILRAALLLFGSNSWAEEKTEFTEWVYETSGGYWDQQPLISTSLEDNNGLYINISASCPPYLGSTLRFNIWVEGYEWEDVEGRLLLTVYHEGGHRYFNFGRVKTFNKEGNYQLSDEDRIPELFDALYNAKYGFDLEFEIKHKPRMFRGYTYTKNTIKKAYSELYKSCKL